MVEGDVAGKERPRRTATASLRRWTDGASPAGPRSPSPRDPVAQESAAAGGGAVAPAGGSSFATARQAAVVAVSAVRGAVEASRPCQEPKALRLDAGFLVPALLTKHANPSPCLSFCPGHHHDGSRCSNWGRRLQRNPELFFLASAATHFGSLFHPRRRLTACRLPSVRENGGISFSLTLLNMSRTKQRGKGCSPASRAGSRSPEGVAVAGGHFLEGLDEEDRRARLGARG
jgi:hypothetical protein